MTEQKKFEIKERITSLKAQLCLLFEWNSGDKLEFRDYGEDQIVVSNPTLTGQKLELIINSKGQIVQYLSKNKDDSSFTVKNNRIHHYGL